MKQHKITTRLTIYFLSSLIFLSIIFAIVFMMLFKENILSIEKNNMKEQSQSIAKAISPLLENRDDNHQQKSQGKGSGYGAYLRYINETSLNDVWIIDNEKELISQSSRSKNYKDITYKDIPKEALILVDEILNNKITTTENFSTYLKEETLSVATPIVDSNKKVIGAVVLHKSISGIQEANKSGVSILIISISLSLLISGVLSIILSKKFTKPIKEISDNTKELAKGNFMIKNKVFKNDELGQLALDINKLAYYLHTAKLADEQTERNRQEFIANITHELKTPVTIIKSKLEAIDDNIIDNTVDRKKTLDEIRIELDMLSKLIYDLLELAKLQSDDFIINKNKVIVNNIINEVVRSFINIAKKKNIEIIKQVDNELVEINADYVRIRQLFSILVDNAIKFSENNSSILIIINEKFISVIDYGNKLNKEDIPYLFKRFYFSSNSVNGNGLGLTIAKEIIDKHNFRIEITQENNTNFTVYFE